MQNSAGFAEIGSQLARMLVPGFDNRLRKLLCLFKIYLNFMTSGKLQDLAYQW